MQIMTIKKITFFLYIALFSTTIINAQLEKKVLFTVDKNAVQVDEFLRVFNKNRDIVAEENKKTVEEYLELYINYKLKLLQAHQLKLDTLPNYINELKKYREQLIKPYLKDAKVTNAIIKETYNRMKQEVNASHILIRLSPKATPTDTLKAYHKILEARTKIINGADFATIAKEYSEDPSAKKNGGDLGYFSAFAMVYPFENAAYNNKIGGISIPFKTSFGYHIVKVNDKRPSRGEVEVAHIMIKNDTASASHAETQIHDIYAKLKQGDTFEFLAQKYSDDRASAPKGGLLPKFSPDRMIESFSKVAFALQNENDISKPFETPYGWHIVRLIKKHPIKDFESLKNELAQKIERSERALASGKSVANRLKKEYSITINDELKTAFLNSEINKLEQNTSKTIFSINKKETKLEELKDYNTKMRKKSLNEVFNTLLDDKIMEYYKDNLENTNKEFAITMQEYKDGLLLFDLLQKKVWQRSETDTVGLKKYFNAHKNNYKFKKRGNVVIATCTQKEKALKVKKLLAIGKTIDEIKTLVNENPIIHVLLSKGVVEENSRKLPKGFQLEKGVSKIYTEGKNQFIIVKVNSIIEPTLKTFKEAKGLVMNDYQEHLEKEWIKELRNNHTVKINKRTLKKVTKKYSN